MAAFSDYLEAQLLNHIFRADSFQKPSNVSVALTGSVETRAVAPSELHQESMVAFEHWICAMSL